ncbi:MAG: hypothetical protein ETSY1_27825 [Candidatus Entotheonella factor]|uniref:Uncharacterized protein n=1 Tax=Entotheonella factor TaxID=1429438 RepID=W4LDW9_ENTF1|nr:MAG: hypothetical protein ETSY1_27825 [Candidatus Entotheonella factor]
MIISQYLTISEITANHVFPASELARTTLRLRDLNHAFDIPNAGWCPKIIALELTDDVRSYEVLQNPKFIPRRTPWNDPTSPLYRVSMWNANILDNRSQAT